MPSLSANALPSVKNLNEDTYSINDNSKNFNQNELTVKENLKRVIIKHFALFCRCFKQKRTVSRKRFEQRLYAPRYCQLQYKRYKRYFQV
jgi:hypothetical protein